MAWLANVKTIALVLLLCGIGGCARGPAVPRGAQLIWYGEGRFAIPTGPRPDGTAYLYEEESGKVIYVTYWPGNTSLNMNVLKPKKHYRLYFVEESLGATTRPAVK